MTNPATDQDTGSPQKDAPDPWSIGIVCDSASGIAEAVHRLESSGQHNLRLFVRSETVVPATCSYVPITVLDQRLSGQAAERFMLAELLMRTPSAGMALIMKTGTERIGIDRWCRSIHQKVSSMETPCLFVDDAQTPSLCAVSTAVAKTFLSDPEGLSAALQRPESPSPFGTALIDWALRTDALLVEIPLDDRHSGEPDNSNASATTGSANETIRVSGTRVSIVVPSWNCAAYLPACLRSLLRQSVSTEVIVVDDASTDDTRQVLETFGDRLVVVRHASQRGANAARNTGIAAASGDFIAFADADNEYSPRWVEHLLQAMLADSSAALTYCGYTKQSPDRSRVENRGAPWDLDTLWYSNSIDMSSLVRRSAIPATGLPEGFRPFDDWRLWLNMAQRGWRGVWVPELLFVKHVRDAGKTEQSMANPAQRGRDIAQVRRDFAAIVGLEKPISVVIPASGCDDLTTRCLNHLSDFCGVPFYVVYVDNGSPLATLDTVVQAADDGGFSLRIIRNLQNRGFTHAVNQGIDASGNSHVLVLNNDCFIGPGCIENLARELRFNDRVAAAGPLTGDNGNQSLKKDKRRSLLQLPDDVLEQLDDPVRLSFRLSHKLRSVSEPALAFFCALLRREALTRYGKLDSRFASGLAADDEWCLRVRNHGQEVRLVLNAYAAHLHRSSFQRLHIDRDALQQDAQKLLQQVLASGPKAGEA